MSRLRGAVDRPEWMVHDAPRTLITAAPAVPNGSLDLVHLAGPYVGADVLVRAERLKGRSARIVVGVDDHDSCVPVTAAREASTCDALADRRAAEIERLFHRARLSTSWLLRTRRSSVHRAVTESFLGALVASGQLEQRTEEAPFCAGCERYLFEAYIAGECPHCAEETSGSVCEACGWPNRCVDLGHPRCTLCGATPTLRSVTRVVFPVSRWRHRLRDHVEHSSMSPELRALAETLLDRRLPDVPVSHHTDWGLAIDVPGFEDQRVSDWAEMLPGYMAGTAAMASAERDSRAWSRAWLDEDVEIVQFFGFHQAYFHLLLHPALLLAWRQDANLPRAYVASDLRAGAGELGAGELRAGEVLEALEPDPVRFVLAADRPDARRTELDGERFAELLEGELIGHWDAWLSDLLRRLRARGGVPVDDERTKSLNEGYLTQLDALAELGLGALDARDFSPPRACRMMRALVREGERLAAGSTRFGAEQSGGESVLWLEALTALRLAQVAAPVMPTFAAALWRGLGLRGRVMRTEPARLPASGNPAGEIGALFEPLTTAQQRALRLPARSGSERARRATLADLEAR